MTRRSLKQRMGGVAARAAILLQAAFPALADPPPAPPAAAHAVEEILFPRIGDSRDRGGWLRSTFHLQKKAGFAYTHRFEASERPVVFRIQGPVLRKQKALGLTFKIRF